MSAFRAYGMERKNTMVERIFVQYLPDLIEAEEYSGDPHGRRVRLRIHCTDGGIEVMGDAMRADELEKLLLELSLNIIEQMLCG